MIETDELSPELKKPVFGRLLSYMRPHAGTLLIALILLLLGTASDVIGPMLIKIFIDHYLTPQHFPTGPLTWLGVDYLGLQVLAAGFNLAQLLLFQRVALYVIQQLRVDLFAHVQRLGLAYFDRTPVGVLVSRITNDTESIKDMYVSVLGSFIRNAVLLVGIFVSMFVLDVHLATICLALVPIILSIMWLYRKVTSPIFHAARRRLSLLNAKLNESLQGMYLIQALRQEKRLQHEFGAINHAYRSARLRNIKYNGLLLRPLVDVVYMLTLMLVLSFFGLQSLSATIDIGVLYAFINYLDRFFEPVNDMMQRLNLLQQALVSAQRVFTILDENSHAPTQEGDEQPVIARGRIQFDHVTFSYDGQTDVLRDISFTAEPGQTVALVGHTGSGKSSIVNLLLRFYPIEHGRITIDGVDLRHFADVELRTRIGLVLQDPFLFAGDIRANVRLGNEHVRDDQIEAAARFVQADTFIQKLPNGYAESIGERGATLSMGQRQLLSFARTMAIEPKVLVLDEATASIDTETEELIQTSLERMRRGRTTIAIAHRLSTIQDADLILVLHRGEIVERGTHQALLAQAGLYHKMFLLQQGNNTGTERVGLRRGVTVESPDVG